MLKLFLILFLPIFLACSPMLAEQPECNQEVDFYGDAFWILSPDSLNAKLVTNIEGNLRTKIGAESDSGQVVVGTLVGTFHAPLGDDKFDSSGTLYVSGFLKQDGDHFSIILNVLFGTEGFAKTRGYIDFDWNKSDDRIYYVGTFCFE